MPSAINPKVKRKIYGRTWPRARATVKVKAMMFPGVAVKVVSDNKEVLVVALEASDLAPPKEEATGVPSMAASQEEKTQVDTISGSTRSLNITDMNPSSLGGKPCSSLTARLLALLSLDLVARVLRANMVPQVGAPNRMTILDHPVDSSPSTETFR